MTRLLLATLLLALLYSGYWALSARTTMASLRDLPERFAEAGWSLSWSDIDLRGFPSRLDVTISDPFLEAPSGDTWSAPFLQSLQLTYRRNGAIYAFPERQTLTLGSVPVEIADSGLRASVRHGQSIVEAETMSFDWPGHALEADGVLAAMRPDPADTALVQLYLSADDLRLDGASLGPVTLSGEARARFDLPLPPVLTLAGVTVTEVSFGSETAAAALSEAIGPDFPAFADALQRQ